MRMEAESRGMVEILTSQASGLSKVVSAAGGNPNDAIRLMIADKLEDIVRVQVEAIKNLKIDKVTVWDSNGGSGTAGTTATANYHSGIMKSSPPMSEMFNMTGKDLPEYLGKNKEAVAQATEIDPATLEA